jgi:hypothetical protein
LLTVTNSQLTALDPAVRARVASYESSFDFSDTRVASFANPMNGNDGGVAS